VNVLGKTRRVHFVGIGGIGMSGIAELLVNLGYQVSGSDAKASETTERLTRLGVDVGIGHRAENVGDVDVVVFSSAIRADNPEMLAARARRITVIPRAELLGELMRLRFGIAIAGAHGKTTTTSMIALVLERAGLDPTAVIGGRLSAFGSNARLGQGACMVAEADESDRSFLQLFPSMAVITNIDREHMEAYAGLDDLRQAFVDFANKVPFYGAIVACIDNAEVAALVPRFARKLITYGLSSADASIGAVDVQLKGFGSVCTVIRRRHGEGQRHDVLGPLTLEVPGHHSVQNALAAIAVALELEVPFERITAALGDFRGAERRFQHIGVVNSIRVVDDYGHHPTEIAAVLAAARAACPARIVVAFQPHRYTRTRDLMAEFSDVLASPDELVLTDIYAASEAPIPGITIEALAAAVDAQRATPARIVRSVGGVAAAVAEIARPGDLVIVLGAGSIGSVPAQVVVELERRHGAERVH
jgi:UDP-N-acetylmuramate--alanine ligase